MPLVYDTWSMILIVFGVAGFFLYQIFSAWKKREDEKYFEKRKKDLEAKLMPFFVKPSLERELSEKWGSYEFWKSDGDVQREYSRQLQILKDKYGLRSGLRWDVRLKHIDLFFSLYGIIREETFKLVCRCDDASQIILAKAIEDNVNEYTKKNKLHRPELKFYFKASGKKAIFCPPNIYFSKDRYLVTEPYTDTSNPGVRNWLVILDQIEKDWKEEKKRLDQLTESWRRAGILRK